MPMIYGIDVMIGAMSSAIFDTKGPRLSTPGALLGLRRSIRRFHIPCSMMFKS